MAATPKPPSRRHLARVLSEAVPVVNNHADTIEVLKQHAQAAERRLDALEALRNDDRRATLPRVLTATQRLSWLLRGRL